VGNFSLFAPQHAPVPRTDVPAMISSNFAVDDDVVDAGRIAAWLLIGPNVGNSLWVKHDQVGICPLANDATIRKTKLLGRESCHTEDGLFQREKMLFSGVGA